MKNRLLIFAFLLATVISIAQTININPDKSGEPWLVGGLRLPSQAELNKVHELKIPNRYKTKKLSLPTFLDNSTNDYFRPIFNQSHGSCSQASGIGYTFTYEMNFMRGTSANVQANQYPTHYTYNFLNNGSGANGSWYTDGWDIIKANGCPTVPTYGGLAGSDRKWMSGYTKYESSMENRVKDFFMINVGTPSGLDNLKYWMLDHLDGSATGGIVNFAAGVTGEFYMNSNDIIVEWGHTVNHAMTIVGWDDTIEYDFNGDGIITNDIDTNSDGVVDMKDWERGALIMVNSWGTGFGNGGKAYIMYKLLAEPAGNGGIYYHQVYGIHVKESPEPQLTLKVKMSHEARNRVKIMPGISSDLSSVHPDEVMLLPLFSMQGGDYPMQGINTLPIEFSLDITPLLSYINPNETAKIFLVIQEIDINNEYAGEIIDFSIVDNAGNEYTYTPHNETINSGYTFLSINAALDFEFPTVETASLPIAEVDVAYSKQLTASGGSAPYSWQLVQNYSEENLSETYPTITSTKLTPNNNDDGYATQTLDFDFPFYGNTYSELYITTDGSISFSPTFAYVRSENAIIGNKVISAFAYDLLIDDSSHGIYYEGDSDSATFRWKETLYGDTSANIDVAVTLYPNGSIDFFYGNAITTDLSWASGISNGDGSYEMTSVSGQQDPSNMQLEMQMEAFPIGMTIDSNGLFNGTISEEGSWDVTFKVTDNAMVSGIKVLNLSTSAASVHEIGLNTFTILPNPVKDILNIDYTLHENSHINIAIYDLSGRLIETIVNDQKKAGTYKATWNTKVNSGLFIYKIVSNDLIQSGKIIVE